MLTEPSPLRCADCGAENQITPNDVIRCKECGHRILYKKRTNKGPPQRPAYTSSPASGNSFSPRKRPASG
jgi:DNA-directed RNA polymerase subunit RPC12/RpoP